MASLWKRPESKYWWACYTDRNGRRRKTSTGTADRREALRLASEYEQAARARRTARQAREVIARLHREFTGDALAEMTLREFADSWLVRKAPETSPATLAFYTKSVRKFLTFLAGDADKRLDEISRGDIERFRNANSKTISAKTANHDLKAVKALLRAARQDELISEDPSEFVQATKDTGSATERRPFTLPELRAIVRAADEEWKSMILFALYSGQRLGDVAGLTWQNIDLDKGELRLTTGKTGRRVRLPLAEPLRQHLALLRVPGDRSSPLHPRAFATVRRTGKSGGLSNQFAGLLAAAGLREKKLHRSLGKGRDSAREKLGLSFHSLRHTATTLLHEAGLPPAVVREFIGHDSAAVHDCYVSVGREALQRAAAALPSIAEENEPRDHDLSPGSTASHSS